MYQTPSAGTATLPTYLGFQPRGTFTQNLRQAYNNSAPQNIVGVLNGSSGVGANAVCSFDTGSGALFGNSLISFDALKIGGSATFIFKPFGNTIITSDVNAVSYVGFANTFTTFTPSVGIVWKYIYSPTTPVWTLFVDGVATGTSYSGNAVNSWCRIVISRTSSLGYSTTFTNITLGGAITNTGTYSSLGNDFGIGFLWGNNASGSTQKEFNIDYFGMDLNVFGR